MAGVSMPNRKPGLTSQLLPIAGTVGGAMVGGPAGSIVGNKLGGKLAGDDQAVPQAVESTAIERRLGAPDMPPPGPSQDIANANQALTQLPPDQQQKYGPILRRAQMLDQQQAQQGVV